MRFFNPTMEVRTVLGFPFLKEEIFNFLRQLIYRREISYLNWLKVEMIEII